MLDIYETLKPLVDRVARSVHSSFPGHHSTEDTEQAIWLWVYEKEATVTDILRNNEHWEGALYQLMTWVADSHLKKEDQQAYGYSPEDAYTYPKDALEPILEMVFDYEDWQSFAIKLDMMPRGKGQANETGSQLAAYADVKSAVERLPEDQYNAMIWRYKYNFTYEMVGQELGMTKEGARQLLNRSVSAVQKLLGRKPYSDIRNASGGRTDPSTLAEALAVTERDWSG